MLYENPIFNSGSQNQLKLTLKSSSSVDNISRRHTVYSHRLSKPAVLSNNVSESGLLHHWETIEKYYVNRLESLQKEIDLAISQNMKLSLAREQLVKEILELHQTSIELNTKKKGDDDILSKSNSTTTYYPQGVTLEDKPYTPPTPPLNPAQLSNDTSTDITSSIAPVIEQQGETDTPASATSTLNAPKPGLFRQLSLRLSTRRKRRNEDTISNSSQSEKKIVPEASSSEPLLHPAAVLNTTTNGTRLSSLRRNYKKESVFGTDLIQQAQSEKRKIPSLVLTCVKEIELRGLTVEGIYRKSGVASQLKELQNAFNNNSHKKGPDLSMYPDIHIVASLLKFYLRSLPTPLISNDFMLSPTLTEQERLNKMYVLLHNLPTETYCTIKHLIQHLRRVHQNQSVNLMSSRNLAVVLGPTLMDITSVNEDGDRAIQTIETMILQSHILFADY